MKWVSMLLMARPIVRRKYPQLPEVIQTITKNMLKAGYLQDDGARLMLEEQIKTLILPLCKGQRPPKAAGARVNYYASFHGYCLNASANWQYPFSLEEDTLNLEDKLPEWHLAWIRAANREDRQFTDIRTICKHLEESFPYLTGIQRTAIIWQHFMNDMAKEAWKAYLSGEAPDAPITPAKADEAPHSTKPKLKLFLRKREEAL